MTPIPTVSEILTSLRSFLTAVLPTDVQVVQGQPNRVPEVSASRFVIMSPPRFERLETNVDTSTDAAFTGSIAGTTLTITAVDPRFPNATLAIGSMIFGPNVADGTEVTAFGTGTGQLGTYTVNNSQTAPSETISAGFTTAQMATKVTVALDFHSNDQTAGDLANTVSALMRDPYAVDQFANQSPSYGVVPLYADDAVQRPFLNDSQQIEWRWAVDALLQANIMLTVPQQFADSVTITLRSALADFPT